MSKSGTPPHVLCVAYGGGHIGILSPVALELERRGYRVTAMALTTGATHARALGLKTKNYKDYLHLVDRKRAIEFGEPLAERMHNPTAGIPREESVAYLGINQMENVDALGPELAEEAFRRLGRHAFLPVEFMKKVILEEKADLVLTTNSPKSEMAAQLAAQALGIPRVRVEDLFIEENLVEALKQQAGDLYHRTIMRFRAAPSKICVMCDYAKKLQIRSALPVFDVEIEPDNIVVTGQPIFDVIDEIMKKPAPFHLIPGREKFPTLTWAHQNGTPDEGAVIQILRDWFKAHGKDYNLVVKIHPNMKENEIQELARQFPADQPNLRFIHREFDANTVSWNSHVVISQASTMLAEAAYMGKPVLIFDPHRIRQYSAFVVNGIGYFIDDVKGLQQRMAELTGLGGDSSQVRDSIARGFERMGFKRQGTRHVADLVESLLPTR